MSAIQLIIEYQPVEKNKLRIVTFKIEPDKLELIDKAAALLGLNRSELIREAIEKYVNNLFNHEATLKNPQI